MKQGPGWLESVGALYKFLGFAMLTFQLSCRIIYFKAHTQAATLFQTAGEKLMTGGRRDALQ